jgi:CheY-like chemotaxis protein
MNHRSLSIIVSYPSPTTCHLLEHMLQNDEHQVHCFQDPVTALHALLRTGTVPLPDLVFLSLKSPSHLTGCEALRLLRTHRPQLPVVVICSPDDTLLRLNAEQAGASVFLDEPIHVQSVVALVQRFATQPHPSFK